MLELALASAIMCSASRVESQSSPLSLVEAELLVYQVPALRSFRRQGGQAPTFESMTAEGLDHEHYFVFYVYDSQPTEGSPTIGSFAVNKLTADVIDLGPVVRIDDSELRGAQEIVRRAHGIDLRKVVELRDLPVWRAKSEH